MLASITPLGERGRGSRWWLTMTAFALGATTAGAAAGAVLGALGALATGSGGDARTRLAVLGVGLLLAAALDLMPFPVPGPRRQVNERWLDEFRGWVYGVGFGAQLGIGVSTVVTSAATYAAGLAALLSADAGTGMLILGSYGAIRGLTPLAAARVRRPEQLFALHARLERWRPVVHRGSPLLLLALVGVAAGGLA